MEKKSSNMFSNSASMRELKNRNSLAMLHLRKEIEHFEEQKKMVVSHMEKDKVSQFQFLKEIRVCESNLNPHYHRLLEDKLSKDRLPNGLRKSRKNVQTAPPGNRTGSLGLSAVSPVANILPRTATTALPRHVQTQMELIRDHRRKRPSSHEQAENFLKQLREKEAEDDLLLKELTQFNIERLLLNRIQNGLSRVSGPSKVVDNLQSGRWAGPRKPGFYSFFKTDIIPSHQSKATPAFKPKTLSCKPDSGMGTQLVEPLHFENKPISSSDEHNVEMGTELEENKIAFIPEGKHERSLDGHTSEQITEMAGNELPFDLNVLSAMASGKRRFKSKPVELRIHEFLDKLEVMKKEQDKRLQELPFWEKRRRWAALTRGIGAVLAFSRNKANK